MIINHNMSAINAHRVMKFNTWDVDKSMAKLSSGMRINKSGDDASGMAVSEKMRTQIKGLRQAERNTEDGMSMIQTTEGYMDQISNVIQRIRVLAVQSSNGIYADDDRLLMQIEVSQLVDEIDRVSSQAEFNRMKLLQGDFARDSRTSSMWFHMGPNQHQRERVYIRTMTATALSFKKIDGSIVSVSTAGLANETLGVMDAALDQLNRQRANLGAYYSRLEFAAKGLFAAYENIQASESRIRDADMAEEMVDYTRTQVLVQSGTAMLAQANMKPQSVLQLLR
ncbi:MAG: flagellin [Spirochaetia bacterium]|nr:flagellin [Spirochaetia bacterium]